MASPQKENGYVPIANELYDALIRTRIAGEERQILDLVIRKTYGFNKKEDRISITQFETATGMRRANVCRSISNLVEKAILIKTSSNLGSHYSFNKDFDKWVVVAKKRPSRKSATTSSRNIATKVVAKVLHTKDIIKDNITKDITSIATKVAEPVNEFIGLFREVNPSYETLYANRTQRAAAERLLKKFGFESMRKTLVIVEKTNDQPYAPTITTPLELEKNGGRLKAFLQKNQREQLKNQIISI